MRDCLKMALSLDLRNTSGKTLVSLSVEPSWTGQDVLAAASEAIPWGTEIGSLVTSDSQIFKEDSTVTDMGLQDGSTLTVTLRHSLVPGVYRCKSLSSGPNTAILEDDPSEPSGINTVYTLDLADDGRFTLTREVEAQSNELVTFTPALKRREFLGHLNGTGVFALDFSEQDKQDKIDAVSKSKMDAKRKLEKYCLEMRSKVQRIEMNLQQTIDWLNDNKLVEHDEIQAKQQELESTVKQINEIETVDIKTMSDACDYDIALRLRDRWSVNIVGLVEQTVHHVKEGWQEYGQFVTKELCMTMVKCHSKPARLSDLCDLLPTGQEVKFQPGGYSIEMQNDGSFELRRRETQGYHTNQNFIICGRFDDTAFQYTLDPLDANKQGNQNVTPKEMQLAWSVLHIYIGSGGKVLLDGLRGVVHEQSEYYQETAGEPATVTLDF